jgi:hypothetical protein
VEGRDLGDTVALERAPINTWRARRAMRVLQTEAERGLGVGTRRDQREALDRTTGLHRREEFRIAAGL